MAQRWKANEPWTKLETEELKRLRAEGYGAIEIGRRMQRTKSSIDSKLRQLKLPSMYKPTPPKPGQPKRERAEPAPRAGAVTLPPLPSLTQD